MLIHSLKLTNFLSFGSESEEITLQPLNVIIGANGSGKSNFLEAIDFLRSAPTDMAEPMRKGGGVQDWIWKGHQDAKIATVDAVLEQRNDDHKLRYVASFCSQQGRFQLTDERVENEEPYKTFSNPLFYYRFNAGNPQISDRNKGQTPRQLQLEFVDSDSSVLSQIRDIQHYPEITYLSKELPKIKLYRDWKFGRETAARQPQATDLRNDFLFPDFSNLALVLNQIRMNANAKQRLLHELRRFYPGLDDYDTFINGSTVQIYFTERGLETPVPATRLSDGTLRYLCLLAILCNPTPPPLVCIEEPELGLHPDVIPALADLMKEASEKCQLVVTTHSEILVDALTDTPESVLVCEKTAGGTTLTRLDESQLKPWLEKYSLGELWRDGEIGGNRYGSGEHIRLKS
jgi:predicted ATPase